MELIRLNDIVKTYHLGEVDVPALCGISLSIRRGEMVALMGASGSGKTTLMNILGCLDRPTAGQYWLDGQEMSALSPNERAMVRTEKLGFVFQSFNLLPRTTALQNVLMPLDYSPHRPSKLDRLRSAQVLLEHVGLSDRVDHEPSQMSGGQQQRVAIARSLVNRPALVLADEPTGNLDSHTSAEILQMFRQLNADGITVILVTHDPSVAAYADRTIRIHDGLVVSDGPPAHHVVDGHAAEEGSALLRAPHVPVMGHAAVGGPGSPTVATARLHAAAPPYTAPRTTTGDTVVAHGETVVMRDATLRVDQRDGSLLHKLLPARRRRWLPTLMPPTFRTALGALRRNKMRAALTTLGIIIGVGAVIAMMEIGQGSAAAVQATIASMGANTLMVHSGAASSGGVTFGSGSVMTLTPQDAEEILRQCPAVSIVAPSLRARSTVIYKNRNWVPMFVVGTSPSYLRIRDWRRMDEGTMFTDHDVRTGNTVCVVGQTLKRELFRGQSPIGKSIRIQNVSFRVIGVLSRKGANMVGMDQDDIVIAPWTAIKYRVTGTTLMETNQSAATAVDSANKVNTLSNLYPGSTALYPIPSAAQLANTPQPVRFSNIDTIMVKAASATAIPRAITQIQSLLRQRHHIRPGEVDDFSIRDMTEAISALANTSRLMGALLLVVALISLVVGGVGIMNIMLVSVTERTREIGLRMAVGARSYHILRQFLVEAVVLCLFGGAMGILLGRGVSLLVRAILRWPTETSLPAIIAAVAVSATVGVLFGFYPAWKASRLDPIEALRYE